MLYIWDEHLCASVSEHLDFREWILCIEERISPNRKHPEAEAEPAHVGRTEKENWILRTQQEDWMNSQKMSWE